MPHWKQQLKLFKILKKEKKAAKPYPCSSHNFVSVDLQCFVLLFGGFFWPIFLMQNRFDSQFSFQCYGRWKEIMKFIPHEFISKMCKIALGKAKPLVKKNWFVSLHLQIWPKLSNSHGLWLPKPCCRCCELRHPLKVLVAFCSPCSTAVVAFLFPASL